MYVYYDIDMSITGAAFIEFNRLMSCLSFVISKYWLQGLTRSVFGELFIHYLELNLEKTPEIRIKERKKI